MTFLDISANGPVFYLEDHFSYSYWTFTPTEGKKLLSGTIINYAGLYLAILVVHGAFSIRCNLATFLFLGAVALNVIGVIILWNSTAATHVVNVNDYPKFFGRNIIFQKIAVPQTASTLIDARDFLQAASFLMLHSFGDSCWLCAV